MSIIRSLVCSLGLLLSAFVYAGPVNINTADAETIAEAMTGVGLKKAQAIIEFRNQNGAFKSLEELTQIKGIGHKTLAKNRDNLTIDSASPGK